jgi:multidrug efflux pump subunit AcrA (membrane-fusion protein)
MRFLKHRPTHIVVATILIGLAVFFLYKTIFPSAPERITATVEKGEVLETVSVSGFVEANRIADLAFLSTGVVTDVLIEEGEVVKSGQILATLASPQLVAERAEAVSAVTAARANYAKTISGPRAETVTVSNTNLRNAQNNLMRVTTEEMLVATFYLTD